jgi:RNA polymerase sigma-70 factor (ECF subfamily)
VKALDDAQLISRVLAGDTDAYAVLVGRYQDTLYRYAVGMVHDGDTAADLVQDSFVKAYTSLASCQDPARFGAWVYRILVNRCKDHLKSRRRHTVTLEEDTAAAPESDSPAQVADRSALGRVVERALATLPEAQREAFLMKHLEGRSYEEMAEMLDVSVSALKMRVMRAREALQLLLREVVD